MEQRRIFKIPTELLEILPTYESYSSEKLFLIDSFISQKDGITMEVVVFKKRRSSTIIGYYFGLRLPKLPEGVNVSVTSHFSLVEGDPINVPTDLADDGRSIVKWNDENNTFHGRRSTFKENNHSFESPNKSQSSSRGAGPFGMSDASVSDWGVCLSGFMILELRISSINRTIDSEFYQKMIFEKMFPEYSASELVQLRTRQAELENLVEDSSQKIKEARLQLTKDIEKKADLINTLTADKVKLQKQIAQFESDQSVLRSRIDLLEKEKQNQNIEIKSLELIKCLETCDLSKVKFSGTMAEKQALQIKISDLMIRLAEDIKSCELCPECKVAKRNQAFKPCGHLYFCNSCYKKTDTIRLCPMCAHSIESSIKISF